MNIALNSPRTHLEEKWQQITEPRHTLSKAMVAFWQARPAGGFVIGRDIPSRGAAKFLAHIMIWDPIGDCEDLTLSHMGELLRVRFGNNVTGCKLSELVAADVCAYHCNIDRKLLRTDGIAVFDIHLVEPLRGMSAEIEKVHFEMVTVTAVARNGSGRQIVNAAFYFD